MQTWVSKTLKYARDYVKRAKKNKSKHLQRMNSEKLTLKKNPLHPPKLELKEYLKIGMK